MGACRGVDLVNGIARQSVSKGKAPKLLPRTFNLAAKTPGGLLFISHRRHSSLRSAVQPYGITLKHASQETLNTCRISMWLALSSSLGIRYPFFTDTSCQVVHCNSRSDVGLPVFSWADSCRGRTTSPADCKVLTAQQEADYIVPPRRLAVGIASLRMDQCAEQIWLTSVCAKAPWPQMRYSSIEAHLADPWYPIQNLRRSACHLKYFLRTVRIAYGTV
ncbi:hypothetical protein KC335_g40 [Hortaea werneckii]|nr:hypothetical protein KC335_g40 [Hortaea werneckii]